jgi:hypothetical protein
LEIEMTQHTTNYFNSFIQVSPDCTAVVGTVPTRAGTVAAMQYERLVDAPYQVTSDQLLFGIHADRRALSGQERDQAKQEFFLKGQPCMRASPLVKTFGFGVHHDENGRIAIYPVEGEQYAKFASDNNLEIIKGMRSKRKGS